MSCGVMQSWGPTFVLKKAATPPRPPPAHPRAVGRCPSPSRRGSYAHANRRKIQNSLRHAQILSLPICDIQTLAVASRS